MRSTFALLALVCALSAHAQIPDIIRITPPATLDEQLRGQWRITITNPGGADVSGTRLSLAVHNAQLVAMSPQLVCAPSTTPATGFSDCALPTLTGGGSRFEVLVTLQTTFRYGAVQTLASVGLPGSVPFTHDLTTTFWKDYMVTSTADSGPGTLRQAILDINEQCRPVAGTPVTPCRAAFDIELGIGGDFFHTVELLSPLPALDVPWSSVDGSTENQSNTLGPSVALDGAALHIGNGITVASGMCDVRWLAIGNFPWNGIYAAGEARVNVDRAYIGVNALGFVPTPNGSRGIASEVVVGKITNSFIAHNRRSGIYFAGPRRGLGEVEISGNRIVSNGASGIYVGAYERISGFTVIRDNIIASNAHFGVAINPHALVIVEPNSIHSNGGGGIDIGLDGPTGLVPGFLGRGGVLAPPVITTARYAHGQTTIVGTVERATGVLTTRVYLYANTRLDPDGFAEGQTFLGVVDVEGTTFTVTIPRDLRGMYVNGVTRAFQSVSFMEGEVATSEFGRALRAE